MTISQVLLIPIRKTKELFTLFNSEPATGRWLLLEGGDVEGGYLEIEE